MQWVFSATCAVPIISHGRFVRAGFSVGILVMRGESANLLSVGAIDFGLIVDATVIMVEAFSPARHASARPDVLLASRQQPTGALQGKLAASSRPAWMSTGRSLRAG